VKNAGQNSVFGRRRELHTVIIARGDTIRHFQIRPWVTTLAGMVVAILAVGYLVATSYLVLRDDLIGAAAARQARMQQAYEDRISSLRAQVDRITSRQLLDQQLMETKVSELLARQKLLTQRHGRIGPILDRVENSASAEPPASVPVPPAKPDERAEIGTPALAAYASADIATAPFSFWTTRDVIDTPQSAADRADRLFIEINKSLRSIEDEQLVRISSLAENTDKAADSIADALEEAGLPVDKDYGKGDVGGPLIAIDNASKFEARMRDLDDALDRLDTLKETVVRLPLANPEPGRTITSGFGVRTDPLIGKPALHSGIDFRVPIGNAARTTAAGIVTKAGWNGGYGRMVEVDHGQGFSTRYAHLSRISVKVGDHVEKGEEVGLTGTSGRSTGPHLHYEIRRNGEAVNPLRFLTVGRKVGEFL
jgi:murein DD-endopeptidase MepM/ murein hydrolase activator NlpD